MYTIHYGDIAEEYSSLKEMWQQGDGIPVATRSYTAIVLGYPVYITKDDEVIAEINEDTVLNSLFCDLIKTYE